MAQEIHVGRRVDEAQHAINRERIDRIDQIEALREHDLEDVALEDVLLRGLDRRGPLRLGRVRPYRGKVGELVFRSAGGKGAAFYFGKEEATEEAWRNDWFHSGDMAWIDEDGDFFYAGRKKASMRRRGENISAWEIESVVNQHPAVLESAAHAVPSELSEDEIKLVIVLKPGQMAKPEEILDFCKGKMAYYAIPRYVEFRNSLPKTGTHRMEYGVLKQEGITSQTWDREAAGYVVARDR